MCMCVRSWLVLSSSLFVCALDSAFLTPMVRERGEGHCDASLYSHGEGERLTCCNVTCGALLLLP